SIISLLLNYYPEKTQTDSKAPKISEYAYGEADSVLHRSMLVRCFNIAFLIKGDSMIAART
ncbi:MAG: hypothetical protein COA73_08925, partial [Candidatus Hydrogenedentota bacterium]